MIGQRLLERLSAWPKRRAGRCGACGAPARGRMNGVLFCGKRACVAQVVRKAFKEN